MIIKKVTSELTLLLEQKINSNINDITLGIKNLGPNSLDQFVIDFQIEPNGEWYLWYSTTEDFTELEPESSIRESTADPTTLASGELAGIIVGRLDGRRSIRVRAAAVADTQVKVEIGGENN